MSIQDWGSLFVVDPPFIEGPIWLHVESLFRWWGFRKGITNISSIYNEVLRRGNCIEQARAGLVNTIGISFVKDLDGARAAGTIAHASHLLATIERLDVVDSDKMEVGIVLIHPRRGHQTWFVCHIGQVEGILTLAIQSSHLA
jgi:hypothetical protein